MSQAKPGEVVVITGATAGVGRAVAREFAARGAKVGLLARGPDGLAGAKADVERIGGQAVTVVTDVADPDQVESAARQVEQAFGPIDVWVNNAMCSVFGEVIEIEPAEFKRVTEVTYLGVVYGTMSALRRMWDRDRGSIVQVGSALAERSIPLQSAYCGAKHAIRGFTDSLRCELIHHQKHIGLTMVQLPAMNTPQFGWVRSYLDKKPQPVPPIYQPEVGARAIYWAAHHRKRELYVGISTLKAMIGNKFIAGWLDRFLGKGGYKSQQTDQPESPGRSNNLWAPVPGDHGPHGHFDDRAKPTSYQSRLAMFLSKFGW